MTKENNELAVYDNFDKILQSVINEAQYTILRGKTPEKYIQTRPGKGGKTFRYVPQGYVTSVLNLAFGFDWDWKMIPIAHGKMYELLPQENDLEGKQLRPASIIVHGELTVRIRNPEKITEVIATITKTSTGEREVIKGMTWGGMIKSAESDAFKKASSRLGVALDLYWDDPTGDMIPESEEEIKLKEAVIVATVDLTPQEISAKIPSITDSINENLGTKHTIGEINKVIDNL